MSPLESLQLTTRSKSAVPQYPMTTNYENKQKDLLFIIDRAIKAVSPAPAMHKAIALSGNMLTVENCSYDLSKFEKIMVLGAGKAAASMAHVLENILGDHIHGGMVVTKQGHSLSLQRIKIMESAHPVPDMAGERAAHELLRIAKKTTEKDLVFFLLSGGASALIPAPHPPVTLAHKQATTQLLLDCGADINEINTIRKHLSTLKGGHLAKTLEPSTVITLIISDVVGDPLDVIGSGPTAPDASTFKDCLNILDKYDLRNKIPAEVVKLLKDGKTGQWPETRKNEDSCFKHVQNFIIAGNDLALKGAAKSARELGYTPTIIDPAMQGEARDMAKHLIHVAKSFCEDKKTKLPACLLAGGETTVTIKGNGKGGRNQEMALAAAIELSKIQGCRKRISLACVGTDGGDGPTDAAGALVLPDTLTSAKELGLSANQHLANNDAYPFFTATNTILKTGPTRTNVMDIAIILIDSE